MFRTKICGIQSVTDADACWEAGVDAVGLNFFPPSKRFVERGTAALISEAIREKMLVVGLFVNATLDSIRDTLSDVHVDAIQLHGDERPNLLKSIAKEPLLSDKKILRAIRVSQADPKTAEQEMDEWLAADKHQSIGGFLLDPLREGQYGGTGISFDWEWLARQNFDRVKPLILAGGLTPDNVESAIQQFRPDGVDAAGGVETDGRKDADLIARFQKHAESSFDRN